MSEAAIPFEESGESKGPSLRYKAQTAGLDPNYWYPAALERDLAPGATKEVVFWGDSIALFRTERGAFHAVENRCAHRQLPLSGGDVKGDRIRCRYHGWLYDGDGTLSEVAHDLGGRRMPKACLRSYPVAAKYGVVWIFPGDPDAARDVPLPAIPQLDGAERWDICPIVMTLRAHHSMIVENVCDFNHETLHEGKSPFLGQKFMGHERDGDTIYVRYETRIGRSGWVSRFAGGERSGRITLWYHYPYQGSNTDDKYVHWLYNRPIDAHTTECFFLFLFKEFTLPGTERALPAFLRAPLLKLAERTYIRPVLDQDRWALEEEQRAFERCGDVPSPEPNPIVPAFRRLTVEKWEAYRNRAAAAEGRA